MSCRQSLDTTLLVTRSMLAAHKPEALASAPRDAIGRARELASKGRDPERWIREICGYRATSDCRRMLYELEEGSDVFACGGHSSGKTHYGSAYLLVVRFYIDAAAEGGHGDPVGALLVLVANKAAQILRTSYKAFLEHGEAAMRRGWEIPGYAAASRKSVNWSAHPTRWGMHQETWAREANVESWATVGSSAGLHSDAPILVYAEEAHKLEPQMWNTVDSFGPSLVFAALNPYESGGQAKAMIDARQVRVAEFDCLRHPNVVEGVVSIPGAVTAEQVERKIKDPTQVQRLGSLEEARSELERARSEGRPAMWPSEAESDFLYALPPEGAAERSGPRPDGILGHPEGDPVWYRPGPRFVAGVRGRWPVDDPRRVFPGWAWKSAEDLYRQLRAPTRPPDRVGVDTAEGGPDRIIARPAWGSTCREIWDRYQSHLRVMGSEEALAHALLCSACSGAGKIGSVTCPACWDGIAWPYFGPAVEIPKPARGTAGAGDQEQIAAELLARVGSLPGPIATRWRLDDSGGGYSLRPALARALERAGLPVSVETVSFGGAAPEMDEPPRAFANMRAYIHGIVAAVLTLRAVAAAGTRNLEEETRPLEWQVAKGRRDLVYKLQAKDELRALLRRSPDDIDALVITEGEVDTGLGGAAGVTLRVWS